MENENKLGQEPAFPYVDENAIIGNTPSGQQGINKRFYAACAAMQGLLAKYNLNNPSDQGIICQLSYELADELLKQENL